MPGRYFRLIRARRCDALGDHHVDPAVGIDLDDREGVLGELDVILGRAVQRLCDPGAEAGTVASAPVALATVPSAGVLYSVDEGREALADAAHDASQRRIE